MVCAKVLECETQPDGSFHTCADIGTGTVCPDTACPNLHAGDLVAYNTKTGSYCTLDDLHAQQAEFPTASQTASLSSARTASPATISSPSSTPTTM